MKTTLTIFALMTVLHFSSFAQDEDVLRPHGGGRMGASSSNSSSSSTPIMLGIEGGINYNMFSQTMSGIVPNSRFAVFESGSGVSPFIGAFVDIGLAHNLGLQIKLAYDQKNFSNTKDAIRTCQYIDPILGPQVTNANVTGEFTNSITYIDITPQLRWNITPEFFILVGPTAHIKIGSASQTFTETISSDGACFYNFGLPTQSKTFQVSSDSVAVTSTRFGAQIDVGYKIPLSPSIFLVPKAGIQYMFTKLAEDEAAIDDSKAVSDPNSPTGYTGLVPFTANDKMLHSLQFSLGLWFQL
ncbi:MAG: outer membrane beta-barrel protein [Ignavibacteriae bacterium]|nr:outer membrane beta-barrel protein [Ignavibacteriota bacterium]